MSQHRHEDWQQLKELEDKAQQPAPVADPAAVETAVAAERARCLAAVQAEIDHGKQAGIPETSAAMRILFRVLAAVQNG